jgi:hypothetical protein
MPQKPLELPIAVAKAFVRDMQARRERDVRADEGRVAVRIARPQNHFFRETIFNLILQKTSETIYVLWGDIR